MPRHSNSPSGRSDRSIRSIRSQLALYSSPASSPLHLSPVSPRTWRTAKQLITQETRLPLLSDPVDVSMEDISYPSSAPTLLGIDFRCKHYHAPSNTADSHTCPSPAEDDSEIDQYDREPNCPPRFGSSDLQVSSLSHFDPLPLPRFAEVRKWLKDQLAMVETSPLPHSNGLEGVEPNDASSDVSMQDNELMTPLNSPETNSLRLHHQERRSESCSEINAHLSPTETSSSDDLMDTHPGDGSPSPWTRSRVKTSSRALDSAQEKLSGKSETPKPGKLPKKFGSPLPDHLYRSSTARSPFEKFYAPLDGPPSSLSRRH